MTRTRHPPRLIEALKHIERVGSLSPMRDATCLQVGRLWDYIHEMKLATMTADAELMWALTDAGREIKEESDMGPYSETPDNKLFMEQLRRGSRS